MSRLHLCLSSATTHCRSLASTVHCVGSRMSKPHCAVSGSLHVSKSNQPAVCRADGDRGSCSSPALVCGVSCVASCRAAVSCPDHQPITCRTEASEARQQAAEGRAGSAVEGRPLPPTCLLSAPIRAAIATVSALHRHSVAEQSVRRGRTSTSPHW